MVFSSCRHLSLLSCFLQPVYCLLGGPPRHQTANGGGLKFLAAPGHPRILMVTPLRGQNGSRGLQDCSKRRRREPQEARTAQDGPKTAHDGPKTAQDAPKTAQEASKRPPKKAPRGQNRQFSIGFSMILAFSPFLLSDVPRRPKRPPRPPQDGPRGSHEGP